MYYPVVETGFLRFKLASFEDTACCETQTATTQSTPTSDTRNYIRLKSGLMANYTMKAGERLRLDCEFESNESVDNIYWLRNLEEIIHAKRGRISVMHRNQSTS